MRCGFRASTLKRGINGDICRVYSDRGEVQLTAYVTNRMTPGTAAVHHGAWFQTDGSQAEMNKFGTDLRGTPNILLDDGHLPHLLGALIIVRFGRGGEDRRWRCRGIRPRGRARWHARRERGAWACAVRWAKRSRR